MDESTPTNNIAAANGAKRASSRTRLGLGALVGLVTVLGFALRAWRLGEVPFGFHVDEGHYALDALEIARGWRPVFLPGNNGREPLFAYLMALPLALLGPSVWAARLAGVAAGTLFLPAQFTFAKGLPAPRSGRVAVIACTLAAVTFWPVSQARYALRAGMLPLWVALLLWAWWRAMDAAFSDDGSADGAAIVKSPDSPSTHHTPDGARPKGRRRYDPSRGFEVALACHWPAIVAGAFLAAAVYTHLAGRLLPIAVVISGLWVAWRSRRREPLVAIAVALTVAALLVLPLVGYFADHPDMLAYRTDQVSVLNPEVNGGDLLGTLAHNGRRLLEMPFIRGDTSWYHNLRDRPVFDPLIGLFFLVGSLLFARDLIGRRGQRAQAAALLVGTTLALMLAGSWLSIGAPNYVRLTGTWPVLFLLAARGLDGCASWLEGRMGMTGFGGWRRTPIRSPRRVAIAAVALVLFASTVTTARDYFVRYGPRAETYVAFNGPAIERGLIVADHAGDGTTYVSPSIWRQAVLRFLLAESTVVSYDLNTGLVVPAQGNANYVFEASQTTAVRDFEQQHPHLPRSDVTDDRGAPSVVLFGGAGPARSPDLPRDVGTASDVVFGPSIELKSVSFAAGDETDGIERPFALDPGSPHAGETTAVRPGDTFTLTLVLEAVQPTDVDHNLFVHVIDNEGHTIGQFDGPPLGGTYGTHQWAPGESILQPVLIQIDETATSGSAEVLVGWYDWRSGTRLPVFGDADAAVNVGAIRIRPD